MEPGPVYPIRSAQGHIYQKGKSAKGWELSYPWEGSKGHVCWALVRRDSKCCDFEAKINSLQKNVKVIYSPVLHPTLVRISFFCGTQKVVFFKNILDSFLI